MPEKSFAPEPNDIRDELNGNSENMNEVEGEVAVRIARKAVDAEARGETSGIVDAPSSFREKRGVFVTLSTYPTA